MECIEILVDGIPLKQYRSENGVFVTAVADKEYQIKILNTSPDYSYVLNVDGLLNWSNYRGNPLETSLNFRLNKKRYATLKFKKATLSRDEDTPINPDSLGKIEANIHKVIPKKLKETSDSEAESSKSESSDSEDKNDIKPLLEQKSESIGSVIGTAFEPNSRKVRQRKHSVWKKGKLLGKVPPVFYREPSIMKILCLPGLPPPLDNWTNWMSKTLHIEDLQPEEPQWERSLLKDYTEIELDTLLETKSKTNQFSKLGHTLGLVEDSNSFWRCMALILLKDEDKWTSMTAMAIEEIEQHTRHYDCKVKYIRHGKLEDPEHIIQALVEHLHLSIGILTGKNELYMAKAELSPFGDKFYLLGYLGKNKFVVLHPPREATTRRVPIKRSPEEPVQVAKKVKKEQTEPVFVDLTE